MDQRVCDTDGASRIYRVEDERCHLLADYASDGTVVDIYVLFLGDDHHSFLGDNVGKCGVFSMDTSILSSNEPLLFDVFVLVVGDISTLLFFFGLLHPLSNGFAA